MLVTLLHCQIESYFLTMLFLILGVLCGAAGMYLYTRTSSVPLWQQISDRIYQRAGRTAQEIANDIKQEFYRQYPDTDSIMKNLKCKGVDYPTLELEMRGTVAEVDDLITLASYKDRSVERLLGSEKDDRVHIGFMKDKCQSCEYHYCTDACQGVGHYVRYWVLFQFPHLKRFCHTVLN